MAGYTPAQIAALLEGPADVAPNGTAYNFDVRPPRNQEGIAVVAVCLTLVTTAVLLRAYSRIRVTKNAFIEDYLALVGFGIYVGVVWAILAYIAKGGFFVHQWDIQLKNMLDLTYRMYIFSVCYSASLLFAKAAILLEWIRIFVPRGMRNRFFWSASILLTINTLLYIAATVAVVCSCIPPRREWNPFIEGTCLDRKVLDATAAIFNLVVDIAIIVLPQRKIWSLQMTTSRKLGVSVVFSFGVLSVVSAIGRIHATFTTIYPAGNGTGDTSYTVSPLLLWCLAETTCVFLVFCAPMVPGAFSSTTMLGRAVASVRSWTRMVSSSSRLGGGSAGGKGASSGSSDVQMFQNNKQGWPKTIGSATQNPHQHHWGGHQRLSDEHDLYGDGDGDGAAVGLADMGHARTAAVAAGRGGTPGGHVGAYRGHMAAPSDTSILKTTEFMQHEEEDPADHTSAYPYHERQHPWIGR